EAVQAEAVQLGGGDAVPGERGVQGARRVVPEHRALAGSDGPGYDDLAVALERDVASKVVASDVGGDLPVAASEGRVERAGGGVPAQGDGARRRAEGGPRRDDRAIALDRHSLELAATRSKVRGGVAVRVVEGRV